MEDTGNTPQFSPVIKIKEKKGHIWQSDIQGVFFFFIIRIMRKGRRERRNSRIMMHKGLVIKD
jgi:hypothetical protein